MAGHFAIMEFTKKQLKELLIHEYQKRVEHTNQNNTVIPTYKVRPLSYFLHYFKTQIEIVLNCIFLLIFIFFFNL